MRYQSQANLDAAREVERVIHYAFCACDNGFILGRPVPFSAEQYALHPCFIREEVRYDGVALPCFLQEEVKYDGVALLRFLQEEVKYDGVALPHFPQEEAMYNGFVLPRFSQEEVKYNGFALPRFSQEEAMYDGVALPCFASEILYDGLPLFGPLPEGTMHGRVVLPSILPEEQANRNIATRFLAVPAGHDLCIDPRFRNLPTTAQGPAAPTEHMYHEPRNASPPMLGMYQDEAVLYLAGAYVASVASGATGARQRALFAIAKLLRIDANIAAMTAAEFEQHWINRLAQIKLVYRGTRGGDSLRSVFVMTVGMAYEEYCGCGRIHGMDVAGTLVELCRAEPEFAQELKQFRAFYSLPSVCDGDGSEEEDYEGYEEYKGCYDDGYGE